MVYEDANGYLSVDYIGIIPLLIQSIKELKAELDALSSGTNVKQNTPTNITNNSSNVSIDETSLATLYQNTPNPFTQSTQIKYYLPKTVNKALLCIYDLQGKQLKQIMITERGEGIQTINGSEFFCRNLSLWTYCGWATSGCKTNGINRVKKLRI
ncbi:MAG: hypothetical protein QM751_00650 [Paludibacteraceae bacterium]